MIDFARITIKAGDGGRGSGSFMHLKGKRRGKADGGDGGRGGSVYLVTSNDLNTLEPFRFLKHYEAQNGALGLSRKRKGAEGQDLEIKVPVGTVVTENLQPSKSSQPSQPIDLNLSSQKLLAAQGGAGGRGNIHLKDEFGRRPRQGEAGHTGEVKELTLELKLIADVGLIGLPNAGKSTLLKALTAATPKIADYPFTTLEPNLGVLKTGASDYTIDPKPYTLVLADIPGLIEGASEGRGLGDLFLRHIERTKILVHVIDACASNLWENYQVIRRELKNYSKTLTSKKEIIVFNKTDLIDEDQLEKHLLEFKSHRKKALKISAIEKVGLDLLVREISQKIK